MNPLWIAISCLFLGLAIGAGIIILLIKYPGNNFLTPMIETFFVRLRNKALAAVSEEISYTMKMYGKIFEMKADFYRALSNFNAHFAELGIIKDIEDMEKDRLRTLYEIQRDFSEIHDRLDNF